MKRFTCLALGFSKRLENLSATTALQVAFYDLCREHSRLRVAAAMEAGLTDHVRELDELLGSP